ncbi:DUF262 domain-containing protein [Microbacterium azadirachtae]|uniref:DUF262 domain-containing protein n=1 Tax=Microbacterium azadirachtae TaxID=582680 RepID=UPI0021D4F177|nr:DUF262 domain-containing protein [Microbacterium azadirachtae]UXW87079.1 DUF262 domain-containing protein [Microbacterium azadirachtae]
MQVEQSQLELETIVRRVRDREWDLQPDFQRGEVWDNRRRQRLVDTILRSWYVPAVHLVVTEDNRELVLDGQQRLAAIRDFCNDGIKIDGTLKPEDERIASLHGLKYSQLPEAVRKQVNRFFVTVVKLTDFEPSEPNELFFRLNQSYNLTPAEKRNALFGPAQIQIRDLVRHLAEIGLLAPERIGFSNGRLAYDDIISRACVVLERDTLREHVNNTSVEEFYRNREFESSTLDRIESAGRELLSQIEAVDGSRVKFNKGTLQTWLLYCSWATELSPLAPTLLAQFEATRAAVKAGEEVPRYIGPGVAQMVRLYDDRASYRVTDVSSVLIRDLAIHLFAEHLFDAPSYRQSSLLLEQLSLEPEAAMRLTNEFLTRIDWGTTLDPRRRV